MQPSDKPMRGKRTPETELQFHCEVTDIIRSCTVNGLTSDTYRHFTVTSTFVNSPNWGGKGLVAHFDVDTIRQGRREPPPVIIYVSSILKRITGGEVNSYLHNGGIDYSARTAVAGYYRGVRIIINFRQSRYVRKARSTTPRVRAPKSVVQHRRVLDLE